VLVFTPSPPGTLSESFHYSLLGTGSQDMSALCHSSCIPGSWALKDDMQFIKFDQNAYRYTPWAYLIGQWKMIWPSVAWAIIACLDPVDNSTLLWVIDAWVQTKPFLWFSRPSQRWMTTFYLLDTCNKTIIHYSLKLEPGNLRNVLDSNPRENQVNPFSPWVSWT